MYDRATRDMIDLIREEVRVELKLDVDAVNQNYADVVDRVSALEEGVDDFSDVFERLDLVENGLEGLEKEIEENRFNQMMSEVS